RTAQTGITLARLVLPAIFVRIVPVAMHGAVSAPLVGAIVGVTREPVAGRYRPSWRTSANQWVPVKHSIRVFTGNRDCPIPGPGELHYPIPLPRRGVVSSPHTGDLPNRVEDYPIVARRRFPMVQRLLRGQIPGDDDGVKCSYGLESECSGSRRNITPLPVGF